MLDKKVKENSWNMELSMGTLRHHSSYSICSPCTKNTKVHLFNTLWQTLGQLSNEWTLILRNMIMSHYGKETDNPLWISVTQETFRRQNPSPPTQLNRFELL